MWRFFPPYVGALLAAPVLGFAIPPADDGGVPGLIIGVLSVAAGFSVLQTCVMSLVCFTGASQIMFVTMIGAGGSAAAALPPAVLLAARNGIYALTLGSVLRRGGWRRAVDAHHRRGCRHRCRSCRGPGPACCRSERRNSGRSLFA